MKKEKLNLENNGDGTYTIKDMKLISYNPHN